MYIDINDFSGDEKLLTLKLLLDNLDKEFFRSDDVDLSHPMMSVIRKPKQRNLQM